MQSRNIPSLDGLRAISVLMVVGAHLTGMLAAGMPMLPFWLYLVWGALGVQMFFVISGFLITHLLLKELRSTDSLNLGRFYFRRAMRIFPPLYAYIAVCLALTVAGYFPGSMKSFLIAGTYTSNYLPINNDLLVHTWSLSLEEQFYLLWPAVLLFFGSKRSVKVAAWVILLSPLSRVVTYFVWPSHRALLNGMLHTGLDSIMFGCVLALLWNDERFNRLITPWLRGRVAAVAALFVLAIGPYVESCFRGSYGLVFGFTLNAICLSQILLYVVRMPRSLLGRVLNTAPLRHLGVISYSLYLWQELFTRQQFLRFAPWNLLAILLSAELSYWIIERPSLWLRNQWEQTAPWSRRVAAQSLQG